MNFRNSSISLLAFIGLTLGSVSFGHGKHCHLKDAEGNLTDLKTAKTAEECAKAGGEFKSHPHCKIGAVDHPEIHSESKCVAEHGAMKEHHAE